MRKLFLFLLLAVVPIPASAEMVRTATIDCKGICLHTWPKLQPIAGWHQDVDASYNFNANMIIPDGSTFSDADTVMYANAVYKPNDPETKSLAQFIKGDEDRFRSDHPGIEIKETSSVTDGDGKPFRSVSFIKKGQIWERVTYGEENDFYLVFTVSSRTQAGYEKTMGLYEKLIASYKEKY